MTRGLRTVTVPAAIEELFGAAEQVVSKYFQERKDDPEHGTIEISGERYILVRGASLSVEFFGLVRELYGHDRSQEADEFARNILFDLAHAIGRKDAKNFHSKMGLTDPIARLSAGPVHFAHAGWAHVNIFPESRPTPDESYFLIYDHPYSFESDAWLRSGERSELPMCIMNAGYSSGWCQESFGVELVAAEVRCRARGDDSCRFVMAPPKRIEAYVRRELVSGTPIIPDFFSRKRAEEQLRRAHADLEARVEARTADLKREMDERRRIERELGQQRKLEALGRLAGGVAHDFNNLMAVVMTNGALLERALPPDDPNHGYVEAMQSAAHRAAALTRQLLAFGKASSDSGESVELDLVVSELGRMLSRLIGDDVDLKLRLDAPAARVRADRTEIEQVVVNLVVNARDAMPYGGRLTLSTSTREGELDGTDCIALKVTDTGVGMDTETQAAIFDPFFTTKAAGGGTGLGLSTVYGIVQRAGGAVHVKSALGEGSTFTVVLPRAPAGVPSSKPRPLQEDATRGRGETILLVEDLAMLRETLRATLEAMGYVVLSTGRPDEALEIIARGAVPRVLLTDIMLPQTNGVALAEMLEQKLPELLVLFMSGNAADALDERREKGMPTHFLAKPFSIEALGKVLREMIEAEGKS